MPEGELAVYKVEAVPEEAYATSLYFIGTTNENYRWCAKVSLCLQML